AVAQRQVPDRVQMIRQHDECVDREGIALASGGDRLSQGSDMIDKQGLSPIQQVYREEPTSARNESATIIRHEAQDSTTGGGLRLRLIRPTILASIVLELVFFVDLVILAWTRRGFLR